MKENQRVWAEINLDNLAHNACILRRLLPSHVKLMAVVKADGYGHGALESAKCALYGGAQYLGAAIVEEGVHLRENCIMEPVLILGYTPQIKMADIVKHNLIQTVFCVDSAKRLSEVALKLGKKARVHIKIDTGMGRLGFLPGRKSLCEILEISNMPGINLEGVYSHFADADNLQSNYSCEQYEKYQAFIGEIEAAGLKGFMKHICNSAGICRFSNMYMDMARSGILLYGLSPSPGMDISHLGLKAVMSVKSRISHVKNLSSGESISYGRSFYTERASVIATVPVGYADGFSRRLSNKGRVIVNGEYAPVTGNICMDQFMIDVTDIAGVKEGSEIILMGEYAGKSLSADWLAKAECVINYEILCNIGKRIPRIYIRNGEIIKFTRL